MKLKPGLPWRLKMLEISEPWAICLGKLLTECGTSPRERRVLQSTNSEGVRVPKSVLTLDIEMQSSVFSLVSFQYFLSMLPSLVFGMVIYILGRYMLEACDLPFDFDFYR